MRFTLICAWIILVLPTNANCTATLTLPDLSNCGDQAVLTCTSTECNVAYVFTKNGATILNQAGPANPRYVNKYSGTLISNSQAQLTIRNIELSDSGTYSCDCRFDPSSPGQTLQYHCIASTSTPSVTERKELSITVDRLYPQPSSIVTALTSSSNQLAGTYTCGFSPTFASHFLCTWVSTPSLPDGNHGYTITVTSGTQTTPVSGSISIVTPTSPNITNLVTLSDNRQVLSGIQDTPLTIQCVSRGGIPAPTLAWYRSSTSLSSLVQSTTSDSIQESDGTYTVTLTYSFTPSRTDNMTTFLCQVSYPKATTEASPDPPPASAPLFIDHGPSTGSTAIFGNQATIASNQIRLNCTSGPTIPACTITWFNRSDVIPNTGGYIRWSGDNNGVITSNILIITTTRYMDGNRITCWCNNSYASDSKYVELDIIYSPLVQQLPNRTAIEGEPDFSLTCSASSKPPAIFTWYKGTTVLASGTGTVTVNSFSYVIPRVDRTDAGSYRCQADNNIGIPDSKNVYLIVKYPPTVTVFITTSLPYTVSCTAEGYPSSYVYRDWVQIWPGYGPVATIPLTGTTLTLTNVNYERSGVYVCGVSNGVAVFGKGLMYKEGNASIIIEGPPVLTDPTPGARRVPVAGRLGQDAIIEIKYWSNVDGSDVKCYKLVGCSRSSSSICSVTETDTEVLLPVYNHMVPEKGTLATITIPITVKEDIADYDIVVINRVQSETILGITVILQESAQSCSSIGSTVAISVSTSVFITVVVVIVSIVVISRRCPHLALRVIHHTCPRESMPSIVQNDIDTSYQTLKGSARQVIYSTLVAAEISEEERGQNVSPSATYETLTLTRSQPVYTSLEAPVAPRPAYENLKS